MQAAVIINLINIYEIQSRLWLISINTHQANQGKVLPNLALLLVISTQAPAIKSGHRCLLQDMIWDGHSVLKDFLR